MSNKLFVLSIDSQKDSSSDIPITDLKVVGPLLKNIKLFMSEQHGLGKSGLIEIYRQRENLFV